MPKIDYSELNGVRLTIQRSRLQILSKFTDFESSISSFFDEPNLSGDSWESAKAYLNQIPPVAKGIFNALSELGEKLETYINSFHGEVGTPKNRLDSDKLSDLNERLKLLQSQKSDILAKMKKAQDLVKYGPGQTLFGTSFGDMGLSSLNNSMEDISKDIEILEKYMTFESNHGSDFDEIMDVLSQLKTGLSGFNRSVSFNSESGSFSAPTVKNQDWYKAVLKFNEAQPNTRTEMVKSYREMKDKNGRTLGYEVVYEIYKNGKLDTEATKNMTQIMREAGIGEVGVLLLEVTGVNNFRRYFNGVDPITGEKLTNNEKSLAGLLGLLDAIGTIEAVKLLKNLNKGYAMLDNVKIPNNIKNGNKVDVPKLSNLTEAEKIKIANQYKQTAPLGIPDSAKINAKTMNAGYEQITYKWNDGQFKYEVRWHTRTPGAPVEQGNTWVVQRTVPGNGGKKPQTFFKIGDNEWIEGYKWYEAINARKAGNATPDQIKILDKGHWKE